MTKRRRTKENNEDSEVSAFRAIYCVEQHITKRGFFFSDVMRKRYYTFTKPSTATMDRIGGELYSLPAFISEDGEIYVLDRARSIEKHELKESFDVYQSGELDDRIE